MKYQVSNQKFPKKTWIAAIILGICGISAGLADDRIPGKPADSPAAKVVDYQMQVEYAGHVTPQASPENEDPASLKLNVRAEFLFSQRELSSGHALRKYRRASAEILLNEVSSKAELPESKRELTVRVSNRKFSRPIEYLAAAVPLTQSELDLLLVPADPCSFSGLLSHRKTAAGESWKPADAAVRGLLAAENLIENNVQISIKESTQGTAKLYLTGDAKAEIEGAICRFQLAGIALLDESKNQIKGLRLTLNETRTASQLAPAFEGQTKIDLRMLTAAEAEQLATQASPTIHPSTPVRLLWSTDSEFELVYDPRWKIILSDQEAVVLRYADQGNLLGQCNIVQLPRRPVDRPLTLDDFREEIEKLLTEKSAQLVSANTYSTSQGLVAHQILVSGTQDNVAIDWIYYHVANADGRRLAMIFTVEHEVTKFFAAADQKLLEAVRFVPLKTAAAASESR